MPPTQHVFVCTFGKDCAKRGADEVYTTLKKRLSKAGLSKQCRVNRAGCMDQCKHGPIVVVYPHGVWYARVDVKGARRIAEDHLEGGAPVDGYDL